MRPPASRHWPPFFGFDLAKGRDLGVEVTGRIRDNRFIDIETKLTGAANATYRKVLDTEESMIREGLIALGWTPPCDAQSH